MAQKAPLAGRRRNPTKAQVEAARAAGVSRGQLAEVLGKRFRSAAAQKMAVDRLISKAGGSHAVQMQDFDSTVRKGRRRGR